MAGSKMIGSVTEPCSNCGATPASAEFKNGRVTGRFLCSECAAPKVYLTCRGAYGRTYETEEQVLADYEAGKDFAIVSEFHGGGRYVSKNDKPENVVLNVRYANDTEVAVIR